MQVVGQVNIGTNIESAGTVNVVNGSAAAASKPEPETQVQPVDQTAPETVNQPEAELEEIEDYTLADTSGILFHHNEQYEPIDYIRIFNAMYELGYFVDETGAKPTKETFFNKIGPVVGLNLSHYSTNLSSSITNSNDFSEGVTTKLFDTLKQKALDYAEIVKKNYKKRHNMK